MSEVIEKEIFGYFVKACMYACSVTRVPHPEPSSLLPPRTIPLSRPSAPAH